MNRILCIPTIVGIKSSIRNLGFGLNSARRFCATSPKYSSFDDYIQRNPKYKDGVVLYRIRVKGEPHEFYRYALSRVGSNHVVVVPDKQMNTYFIRTMMKNLQSLLESADTILNAKDESYSFDQILRYDVISPLANIVCVGHNYPSHCDQWKMDMPENPVIFSKSIRSLSQPNGNVIIPSDLETLDYESELAIIIKDFAFCISEENALKYVAGYMVANDFTDRDVQLNKNGSQYFLGKSRKSFLPIGPGMLIHQPDYGNDDHIHNYFHNSLDPSDFQVQCKVNSELRQEESVSKLIFSIPKIISYVSKFFSLAPGDVILTGSPAGSGHTRSPPQYLKSGDIVESTVFPIGKLVNRVETQREFFVRDRYSSFTQDHSHE